MKTRTRTKRFHFQVQREDNRHSIMSGRRRPQRLASIQLIFCAVLRRLRSSANQSRGFYSAKQNFRPGSRSTAPIFGSRLFFHRCFSGIQSNEKKPKWNLHTGKSYASELRVEGLERDELSRISQTMRARRFRSRARTWKTSRAMSS